MKDLVLDLVLDLNSLRYKENSAQLLICVAKIMVDELTANYGDKIFSSAVFHALIVFSDGQNFQ